MMTLIKLVQANLLAACVCPLLSVESGAAPVAQPVSLFSTGGEPIYTQDPRTNDGAGVGASVTLAGRDGLFLVMDASGSDKREDTSE